MEKEAKIAKSLREFHRKINLPDVGCADETDPLHCNVITMLNKHFQ